MKIILKHTLKNIFCKPGRTILVVLCILICSFVALMSFDLTDSIRNALKNYIGQMIGTTEIVVTGDEEYDIEADQNLPELDYVTIKSYGNTMYFHDDKTYYVAQSKEIIIFSFDFEKAEVMRFASAEKAISSGECLVNEDYFETFDVKIGDVIQVQDVNEELHDLTIKGKSADMAAVANGPAIIVSDDDMNMINPSSNSFTTLIDVKDDSKIIETAKYIEDSHPFFQVTDIYDTASVEETLAKVTKLFMFLLSLCILMVIFVTVSISDRVICERMSVIGTFRSLGFSSKSTTLILLLENTIYGLIGSVLGTGLYSLVRLPFFDMIFQMDSEDMYGLIANYGTVNPIKVIAIIVIAILIECLCALKEIIKAVKTPIRDIIFSTKDADYRFNKITTIIGIASFVVGFVLMFFKEVFACQVISIIGIEIAIALLSPYFFYFIGKLIGDFAEKRGKIIPALAARESYTKKNTVGASTLIATVVSLCILILVYSSTVLYEYQDTDDFICDVSVSWITDEYMAYRYINHLPGVTEVEYQYSTTDYIGVNGEPFSTEYMTYIYRSSENDEGWKLTNNIKGVPGNIASDEIYVSKDFAKKYELEAGDEVTIEFLASYPFSISKTLKVAGIGSYNDVSYLVINADLYDGLFSDMSPSNIRISCDNPEEIAETISDYSDIPMNFGVTTKDQYIESNAEEAAEVVAVIYVIIGISCAITFIGAAGNLLIGFEARKRECAVLLSTSLKRGQLSKAFILESFISSLSAVLFAVPFGILLVNPMVNVFTLLLEDFEVHFDAFNIALTLVVMVIVFTLTSLSPIGKLRKMKLAEQLKYE